MIQQATELMARAGREITELRAALERIAALEGRTILGPETDIERYHELGAARAFADAADIATTALRESHARHADLP